MENIDYGVLEQKANPGAFSIFDMEILVPEVIKLGQGQVYVEVGVDRGRSLSVAKMVAQPGVTLVGVDLRDDPKVPGTVFFQGDSVAMTEEYREEIRVPISLLFIDGDHSYEGCKRDIFAWYPLIAPHGTILFHDHDETSPGVLQAVSEFVNSFGKKTSLQEYRMFKDTGRNTSMARIRL